MKLQEIPSAIKGLVHTLRTDPEALPIIRTLVLGALLCASAYYTGVTMLLGPDQEMLKEAVAQHKALLLTAPGMSDQALIQNIPLQETEIEGLREKIEINRVKEKVLSRQWQILSDAEEFTKTVFTLHRSAPIKIGDNLIKITQLEPRQEETYTIYPLRIAGDTDFTTLFSYLQHLENSSTISMIDDLVIETVLEDSAPGRQPLHFDLLIGRIDLKK